MVKSKDRYGGKKGQAFKKKWGTYLFGSAKKNAEETQDEYQATKVSRV